MKGPSYREVYYLNRVGFGRRTGFDGRMAIVPKLLSKGLGL